MFKESRFAVLFSVLTLSAFGGLSLAPVQVQAAEAAKTIKIGSKGDALAFDQTKLSAKPKQKIKLTFKNNANKTSGMEHNFVLVEIGKDTEVANASIAAGAAKGWLASSPSIIAHTKMIKPGESDTIEFTAPEKAGDYPFLCTFPGHSALMKGVLSVK